MRRRVSGSHGKYLRPLTLDRRDSLKVGKFDRHLVAKRHMRPQEVVVSGEESCEGNSSVGRFKAAGGADVELEGPIETL
ncbi:MAG: hypothetical protein Q8O22_02925, partial [Candidatus Omnitrophota bacterium]|nr:hypothetical protein [Candidatus Omnitrophota bacterium]